MNLHLWIAIVLVALGIAMLAGAVLPFFRPRVPNDSPFAEGTIVKSKVEVVYDDGKFYECQIAYEYEVAGKSYEGTSIGQSGKGVWSWSWPAKNVARTYPVGKRVRVYYAVSAPENAVLEPGPSFGRLLILTVLAAVILVNAWNQFQLIGAHEL